MPPHFVGVVWDKEIQDARPTLQDEQWTRMARSGVESARVIFSWHLAEERQDAPPDFGRTDQMVRNAAEHGIDLLPVIIYAPPWARLDPGDMASAPADLAAFDRYVTELVRRYGPSGYWWRQNPMVPRRPVRSWQIWNEVSQPYQFTPQEGWPARYVDVLRTAALAIRREDPRATIVLSGFANDVWNAIGDVYRVGDVRGLFDAVAVHLYSIKPSDFVEVVRRTRETMDLHGDQRKPIWITEIGASASAGKLSAPGHEHFQTTNRGLARLIRPTFRALAAVRRRYLVERVYWYTWASPYHGGTGVFGYSGLNVFSRGHVKQLPAMAAYRRMARAYEGCRKDARARCVR